ncbi:MAG: response regulator [Sedimentisphaerales bacterium]|nr:response regulator [Sedimentisphaerales bacterium]
MTLSLRVKVLFGLMCVLGFYLLLQYGIQRLVITPGFEQLQQQEAVKDLHRCEDAIHREIYHLSTLAKDWSQWDDTCHFVEDTKGPYVQANLLDETFVGARLNLMFFYDTRGKPIWGRVYDFRNECSIEDEYITDQFTNDYDWLLRHDSLESSIEGILQTGIAPMLLCSKPIINSNGEGLIHGTLIMGRFLDDVEVAGLSKQIRVPFALLDLKTGYSSLEKRGLDQLRSGCKHLIQSGPDHMLQIYTIMPDIHGQSNFLLEAKVPARILAKGQVTIAFAFLSVIGVILVTLIAIYTILRWIVLSRIDKLGSELSRISCSRNLSDRIQNMGTDEVGRLGHGINRMLDQLELAHAELQESGQRLSLHFDQTPLGVVEWNMDFEVIRWNPAAERIFGYSKPEILGRCGLELIVPDHECEKVSAVWSDLLKNHGGTRSIIENRTKNGHILVCEWYDTPLVDGEGCVVGIASLVHDITLEHETKMQLRQAKIAAEEANRSKSLFLANMSHEIRTPMNAIIGFSDLLVEEPLNPSQCDYVETIQSSAQNLLGIIDDILDLSKVEAGQLKIEYESCNLSQILDTIGSMLHPRAQEKSIRFAIHRSSAVPDRIVTDSLRLRQCLVNLIGNAIKFTEQGHVYTDVALEQIDNQAFLRFDIEDTGIGIAPERLEAVFDSFTQADGKTSRQFGGTGLGLTITRRLAELMGGSVSVSSRLNEGSVFTFRIPLVTEDHGDPSLEQNTKPIHYEKKTESEYTHFSGHVLVVEDVSANQILIQSILRRLGLEVVLVDNGQKALEVVQQKSFDLILMDMQMPVMSGYEATRALRENGDKTPIIAFTAHALKGDREKCMKAGCDDYLAKPVRLEEIITICRRYFISDPSATKNIGSNSR